jgi:CheY-like chemotaxis protein
MPRVLTIEDDLVTAEEIATELRSHGFDVDLASDGSNGLALARRRLRGDHPGPHAARHRRPGPGHPCAAKVSPRRC